MKIEKINDNKIKVTVNNSDLEKNNIDIHSFMSNSIESQCLFLGILEEAEIQVGFNTDNYKLTIEALALSDGNFIITVTRVEKENIKSTRVHAYRKQSNSNCQEYIYHFENFDNFCSFTNCLTKSNIQLSINNKHLLYQYNNSFFLILETVNEKLSTLISEFANQIENSELIINKIKECGVLIPHYT